MANPEFILALTEHRFLGPIFIPCLIQNCGNYYSIEAHLKPDDLRSYAYFEFKPYEKELIEICAKYSDQRLIKKFSRTANIAEFYTTLPEGYFAKYISPLVQKYLFQIAQILMLSPVRLFKKDQKYSNLYDEDIIKTHPVYAHPVFYFERNNDGIQYRLKAFIGKNEINLADKFLTVVSNDPCLLIYKNHLVAFESLNSKKLTPFFDKEFVRIPLEMTDKYFSGFILNAIREHEVHASGFKIIQEEKTKSGELTIEKNLNENYSFVFRYLYGEERFELNSKRKLTVRLRHDQGNYVFEKIMRDYDWEKKILKSIENLGLKEDNGFYFPKRSESNQDDNSIYYLVNWLNTKMPILKENGIVVSVINLDKPYFTGIQSIESKIQTINDWFDVYIEVQFGEFKIPFVRLRKYILNDIREFELPDGQIAILPVEWFTQYKGILPLTKLNDDKLIFRNYHYNLLQTRLKGVNISIAEKFKELDKAETTNVALPEGINASLRSYQEVGYRWLFLMHQYKFGACLADDMGLGKTLQTLTLLLKLKRKQLHTISKSGQLDLFSAMADETEKQPASLIVLPTSLVYNWFNEISKFTHGLKVFKYIGLHRKSAQIEKIVLSYDIILTTYGTVRNDIEILKNYDFFYLVLDESQLIKNPSSKTYKAVLELKSQFRLVLTGTPVENSLSDLWAQMNFLNRGILGNLAYFRRFFISPIEKNSSIEQQEKLQELIRPFILRRKKTEVEKDLPPLMEQILYCEMTAEQRKKYEIEKSAVRNTILQNVEKGSIKKSAIVILQGLTKLRQLANHPSMLEEDSEEGSGKYIEIFRMLENVIAENHKVLIFSSFVEHLELVREEIIRRDWKYTILTGKTTNREKVIKKFQSDSDNRIFLISLKAGGVGLNLTQADYVFIIDPWWNPAAENQAINRAHRIGQHKHVFVYRFITEDTIEEKIQFLKEKKSSLADKFINENNPFEGITHQEILELL